MPQNNNQGQKHTSLPLPPSALTPLLPPSLSPPRTFCQSIPEWVSRMLFSRSKYCLRDYFLITPLCCVEIMQYFCKFTKKVILMCDITISLKWPAPSLQVSSVLEGRFQRVSHRNWVPQGAQPNSYFMYSYSIALQFAKMYVMHTHLQK